MTFAAEGDVPYGREPLFMLQQIRANWCCPEQSEDFATTLIGVTGMKCSICSKAIATTFLNKIIGTYVKDKKGKLKPVCFGCQKRFASKEEMIANIQ